MFTKLFQLTCLIGITLNCPVAYLNAQVNFLGGNNDGFAKSSYSQPDPSSDIYSGGVNDGFAMASYAQPDPASDIYDGGINDGFALASYSQPDPANDIYDGGVNDGFAFSSYSQPDPTNIYRGGVNDGFAKFFFSEELALPVEWKYFVVSKKEGKPFLQWSADREEKCMSYEVLRSHDGKSFEAITTLDCHGNAFDNKYEFEDSSPVWYRIYYYKIVQYDIDGQFTQTPVKSFIPAEPSAPEVYYKNSQIIVKTARETKLRSVAIYDYTGRTLCRQVANHEQESYYTIDCYLAPQQLVIVHMTFDTFVTTTHMRVGKP